MSQQRQNKMLSEKSATEFGDKTYTKIFVGGLAWETQRETMKRYFEQFGEILEAVVINDKTTGRSKGYGFVTFKDADSAMRACQIPYPIIDGRRANCNLASLGAQKSRPAVPQHVTGYEKLRPPPRARAPSPYFRQPIPQYAFPYSAYGYPAYPQDIYAMNYYNAYCGQQFPSYYNTGTSGSPGVYLNYYPYAQHGQNSPTQYPKMIQHPYFSQQYHAYGILSAPTSASPSLVVTGPSTPTVAAAVGVLGTASEPQSSAQLK